MAKATKMSENINKRQIEGKGKKILEYQAFLVMTKIETGNVSRSQRKKRTKPGPQSQTCLRRKVDKTEGSKLKSKRLLRECAQRM